MRECFECGTTDDLQEHHVVPRLRGGTKTVTLCHSCHMKAHGRDSKGVNHKKLVKESLSNAKLRGVKLGTSNPVIKDACMKGIKQRGMRTIERLTPVFLELHSLGYATGTDLALALNQRNVKTSMGKPWKSSNARRTMNQVLHRENK